MTMFKKLIEFFKRAFCKKKDEETTTQPTSGASSIDVDSTENTTPDENSESASTSESASSEAVSVEKPETTITPEPQQVESNIKILIDNGHGNNTAGKRSPWSANKTAPEIEFYEYKWNREIANAIVDELKDKGYDAELIVTEEKDISLSERANRVNAICKEHGKNKTILISIHANAAGNGKEWMNARGWCAYTTVGETKSDRLAEFLYDEAEKNFVGMKIRKDNSDGDRDLESNFTVIYKSICPAVLTENFFYDNVEDVRYILSDEGRKAVVKTHVDGIINYINSIEK